MYKVKEKERKRRKKNMKVREKVKYYKGIYFKEKYIFKNFL